MSRVISLMAVELGCPELARSRDFFVDVLGLYPTEHDDGAVTLRCFGESHDSIVLRERPEAGLIKSIWGVDPSDRESEALTSPQGHRVELTSRVDLAPPPSELVSLPNQPAAMRGAGVEPRRLSHVGLVADDVASASQWWQSELGFAVRETVLGPDVVLFAAMLGVTAQACDVLLLNGASPSDGALHHVALAVDDREDLVRAGALLAEAGIEVEAGLGRHGIGQLAYLYCFEPSGNRIALVNSPLLHLREESPARWPDPIRAMRLWGTPLPDSFFTTYT